MKRYSAAFDSAVARLNSAARTTREEMANGALPDEPAITAALVTRIRDALDGYDKAGIRWSAKVLSSHGPGAEERTFGADLAGVLHIEFPDFEVKKGFLAQAKRQNDGKKLSSEKWNKLAEQCERMLTYSNTSFVFVYSLNGFFVVPAISVLGCTDPEDLHTLHPMRIHDFFKQHFWCFVGDNRVQSGPSSILSDLSPRQQLVLEAKLSSLSPGPLFER